jgi:hypothetical protein
LLDGTVDGVFVVRKSDTHSATLSIRIATSSYHTHLEITDEGVHMRVLLFVVCGVVSLRRAYVCEQAFT